MYIVFIILILIASALLILTVLAQNPKSGMAANFGASNQVMGVRQTADFLEKMTWGLAVAILILSLAATMAMPSSSIQSSKSALEQAIEQSAMPQTDSPVLPNQFETEAPAVENETTVEVTPDAEVVTESETVEE